MRNKVLTYIFIFVILLAGLAATILPDMEATFSERRYLYDFEKLQASDDFSGDFEKYVLDHFVFRDLLRRMKAFSEYTFFRKSDNNELYEYNDFIIKQLYPLDEVSVHRLTEKINKIVELYADDNRVFYSVIPDKNYFVDNNKYLKIDYGKMTTILRAGINDEIDYIDLFDSLTLDVYYKTDHHFRIDGLNGVLSTLGAGMDIDLGIDGRDYSLGEFYPFYGAYYGQAAMNIDADTLLYLENDLLKNCSVKIWESFDTFTDYQGVYDYEKLGSMDSYDMFLYGTKPVVTIENPNAKNDREIIIFKDSFANSLTPLLVESYSKITLVDLRLVNHTVLDHFIDFEDADILFLYSTMVVNNSSILK